jgi:hypothetical protein
MTNYLCKNSLELADLVGLEHHLMIEAKVGCCELGSIHPERRSDEGSFSTSAG